MHVEYDGRAFFLDPFRHHDAEHAANVGNNAKNGHASPRRTCYREYVFQILSKNKRPAFATPALSSISWLALQFFTRARANVTRRRFRNAGDPHIAVNYTEVKINFNSRSAFRGNRVKFIRHLSARDRTDFSNAGHCRAHDGNVTL